ncbi:MAG TPA: methyltransferase domain-containing protein [Methanocorpusculum sp.]|nr:methyltransferase domain-containing protein [Methanocorpusculum sp.]HJJ57764.1 methyltransferase domain-containing protein [Methanocorpusculum sp.]HJJ95432.1 methyltransferase domain-containing protein [Methanocorpusculum sp.]
MNLLYELSGENQELSAAEIACVGTVTSRANGIAVADTPYPKETTRLAETHTVSELLGECDGTYHALQELLESLAITADTTYCCRARKIHPAVVDASQLELEKMMGSLITGKVSFKNPETVYRAVFSDGHCWLGRVLYTIDRGGYASRNPSQRAYFHPGVMMPLMARALVNLTCVKPGELLLDPFCGTGGMLLESHIMGVRAVGGDYDSEMLGGCKMNIPDGCIIRADATKMPYPDECFDAVATDLPYGQSTRIGADTLDALYRGSLNEIRRVLKKGRKAVVVTHKDIRSFAEPAGFEVAGFYEQYVHKSLTRRILVLQ